MPPPEPQPTPPAASPAAPQQPVWPQPPQQSAPAQPTHQPYPGQPYLAQDPSQAYPAQNPGQPFPGQYPGQFPAQYYAGEPQHSKTLGVVAFVAGLVVTVASPIISAVTGATVGHLVIPGSGFSAGFTAGANSHDVGTGLLIVVQLLLGSGLGIWALVQGIIAVRKGRGRGWGISAIVLAVAAPVLSIVVYLISAAVSQSAG